MPQAEPEAEHEPQGTEGPFRIGAGVTAPTVISQVQPEYSEEAREARYEGVVVLEGVVRTDGTIEIRRVVRGLGFGLDQKAIEALEQWRFRPGMRGGDPVAVVINIEVNFNLRNQGRQPDAGDESDDAPGDAPVPDDGADGRLGAGIDQVLQQAAIEFKDLIRYFPSEPVTAEDRDAALTRILQLLEGQPQRPPLLTRDR